MVPEDCANPWLDMEVTVLGLVLLLVGLRVDPSCVGSLDFRVFGRLPLTAGLWRDSESGVLEISLTVGRPGFAVVTFERS